MAASDLNMSGAGLTLGFSALVALFGLLSLLARNPAPDHWGLVVASLVLFTLPWIAGFAGNRAAWAAWVAGAIALTLGGIGWLGDKPPTEYGMADYGVAVTSKRRPAREWVGRIAFVVGILAVVLAATGSHSHSSAVGAGLTAGLGFLIAVLALWSMLAVDPTHDHWTLTIAGFALLVAPWMAGFVDDRAAWIAWTGGLVVTVLSGIAYLSDDSSGLSETIRDKSIAVYRRTFR
ncbi:SPW repeat domain-containing protein [Mycolicibacterium fortuitum]|uniref:SPW repeat domain-containing protein n=1 Tax=Mycolicibacterium fortuitum TaxID=1766 RepID=UPI001CE1857E|nr:SPW repeat protein [Mycolicibacterium fortuitum]MCA4727295.1 SPW repeat protein [Mycolicibacterium fortuitum]